MMTVRELEETVADRGGMPDGHKRTPDSQRPQSTFHSTQSITGAQSLLTKDHVQYLSASDALSAYISDFEDSHPLQTSLYERTVEDLLLPRSILSRTVDRSLETGKRDTMEEYHLHNVRRIIDESFDEILNSENRRHKELNEEITQTLGRSRTRPSPEVASLPGKNMSSFSRLTPILKSTPLKPDRGFASSSYLHQKSSNKEPLAGEENLIQSASSAVAASPSLNVTWAPATAKHSKFHGPNFGSGRNTRHKTNLSTTVGQDLDTSGVSLGGRAPPTWVDELDLSSLTLTSLDEGRKGGSAPLGKDQLSDGTLSQYDTMSETDLLEEVGKLLRRRDKHRIDHLKAEAMKERWRQDRTNESRYMKPPRHRATGMGKTESITTDDLVNASPYGLDRRKSVLLPGSNRRDGIYSSGVKIPPGRSHSLKLSRRLSRDVLSKSDDSIHHRHRHRRLGGPELSATQGTTKSAPSISRGDSLRTSEVNGPVSSGPQTLRGTHLRRSVSSTNTESLIHSSPFGLGELSPLVSRKSELSGHHTKDRRILHHPDDDQIGSENGSIDELHTVSSIGETSRVKAVLERAQRLMDASTDEPIKTRPAKPGISSNNIMDRYLSDCEKTSQQESDVHRPLESLKKILFTLQDIDGSQTTEASSVSKISISDDIPDNGDVVSLAPGEPLGTDSMKRAMVHLSKLKELIIQEKHMGGQR